MELIRQVLPELLGVIFLALAAPIGKLVGNLIKQKIDEAKHSNLYDAASILVQYADKFLKKESGRKKLEYVTKRLTKKFSWASQSKITEFIEVALENTRKQLGNEESSEAQ